MADDDRTTRVDELRSVTNEQIVEMFVEELVVGDVDELERLAEL